AEDAVAELEKAWAGLQKGAGQPLSTLRSLYLSAFRNPTVDYTQMRLGVTMPASLRHALVAALPALRREGLEKNRVGMIAEYLTQNTDPKESAQLKNVRAELGLRAPGDIY